MTKFWSNERHVAEDRVEVSLRARLKPIGGPDAPEIKAYNEKQVYRRGERLALRVTGKRGRSNIAVYAWQADDSVVRLYPSMNNSPIALDAGRTLAFPTRGEPHYAAVPLAGASESREALIVIATSGGFSPNDLAPPAGGTPERSVLDAVSSGGFFQEVSRLDLRHLTLRVLPYRVVGSGEKTRARN
jgi:hypothetical protein